MHFVLSKYISKPVNLHIKVKQFLMLWEQFPGDCGVNTVLSDSGDQTGYLMDGSLAENFVKV